MTINTVPSNNSTFTTDLTTFLQEEDPDRFRDMFTGFISSGGTHATGAGLVHSPASLTAYPGGHYITETGAITYPDSTTHIWVICHKDTTTAVTNWTRVSGTHYLFRNTGSGTRPALPVVESAILMKVTTSGGAVTVVVDARILSTSGNILAVTDNAIPRYNGTVGGVLQNSGVIIDDSDNITLTALSTIDGRDISVDGTKLDGIEALADVTDYTNVNAALGAADANFVFNTAGGDFDFTLESDLNPFMFHVNAGNNSVHIDNSLLTGAGDGDLVMANNKSFQFINNAGTTSANTGISLDTSDNLNMHVPATTDTFQLRWAATLKITFNQSNSGAGLNFIGESSSDHPAPSTNNVAIYTRETGGKTELVARFATGAVQQIAIEP